MFKLKNQLISITASFLFGAVISEITIIIYLISNKFYSVQRPTEWHNLSVVLVGIFYTILIISLLIVGYKKGKEIKKRKRSYLHKILLSKRWDIYISFILGYLSSLWFYGYGIYKIDFSFIIKSEVCHFVFITPLFLILGIVLQRTLNINYKENKNNSKFYSDEEIEFAKDDMLNMKKHVEDFASNVYDNKSPNSLVFGLDSPWGSGKTSFIKLCKEYWYENCKDDLIIYTFNPTIYERQEDIFDKFIDGFIVEIKKQIFCPELKSLVQKYFEALKTSVSMHGLFSVDMSMKSKNSIEEIQSMIEDTILLSRQKMIIVIDDFDRLDKSIINNTLTIIKKAFSINNVTYILCYDTENLSRIFSSDEHENVLEFFEKYVNVKYSLYSTSRESLKNYVSKQMSKLNIQPPIENKGSIMYGITSIFESDKYNEYIPHLGDLRKIKRLLNTIKVLGLEKYNLSDFDFDKIDLINLILIYLNYPSVFRKIYNEETDSSRGFFSLVTIFDDGYPGSKEGGYRNSDYFNDYLKGKESNVKFLLNQIFSEERIKNDNQMERNVRACYNGDKHFIGNKNLERYLKLIIENNFPRIHEQYSYYKNIAQGILKDKTINDVLWIQDFDVNNIEKKHNELIRVLLRHYRTELSENKAKQKEILSFLLDNLSYYTYIKIHNDHFGYRHKFIIYIAEIIDIDNYKLERDNPPIWETEIPNIIFENEEDSVLYRIANLQNRIMGVYELLQFSQICSYKRNGFIAVGLAVQNYLKEKHIRFTKSHIFGDYIKNFFKEKYIETNDDYFKEINNLNLEELSGKWYDQLEVVDNISESLQIEKNSMMIYITYQLLHLFVEREDETDEFKKEVQEYLFKVCFGQDNYEQFLDYLLLSFESKNTIYELDLEKMKLRLGEENLKTYWKSNKEKIMQKKYFLKTKQVIEGNYICTYTGDLPIVYEKLDSLID